MTSHGIGKAVNWRKTLAGESSIRPITLFDTTAYRTKSAGQIADLPVAPWRRIRASRVDRASHLLYHAAAEALAESGLAAAEWDASRSAVALGTTLGGMASGERYHQSYVQKGPAHARPSRVVDHLAHAQPLHLMEELSLPGVPRLFCNACGSGADAVGHGFGLVRSGRGDLALCGGYDSLCEFPFAGFHSLQALTSELCRPFDRNRSGLALGYMSQRFSLYGDLTVAENLRFFAGLHRVPRRERLRCEEELYALSRLGPHRDRLAQDLSGGMRQKLALACTLVHSPEVLLLDEPTTGVDPLSRRDFWTILSGLHRGGATVLVSTPYMDEAERCGRVAFLDRGRIRLCDTPEGIRGRMRGELLEVTARPQRLARAALAGLPGVLGMVVYEPRTSEGRPGRAFFAVQAPRSVALKELERAARKAGGVVETLAVVAFEGREDRDTAFAGGLGSRDFVLGMSGEIAWFDSVGGWSQFYGLPGKLTAKELSDRYYKLYQRFGGGRLGHLVREASSGSSRGRSTPERWRGRSARLSGGTRRSTRPSAWSMAVRCSRLPGVEPTAHVHEIVNAFRPDEPRPGLTNEAALSNAPDAEAGCFKVPKVIEG